MKRYLAALAALALISGCDRAPLPAEPPRPALWEVTGPGGAIGWLFGTVHAMPENYDWRTPKIESAVRDAGELLLELGKDEDETAIATIFTGLSRSPGNRPLSQRVPATVRSDLLALMEKAGIADAQSDEIETWAAALMLAHAIDGDQADGVEAGLLKLAGGKPVIELEGAQAQLGIFDALPEQDQRDLLLAILTEADDGKAETARLARQWRRGNMKALETETRRGMLADSGLREALLVNRNLDWAGRIDTRLKAGNRPFVAVGAAHMAGPDGVPALLAARGWTVRRVQ